MIDLAGAIVCIAAMTGLPEAPPPEVKIGGEAGWAREWPETVGLYLHPGATVSGRGIVWVQEGYEHMIPHELVHHLQYSSGLSPNLISAELQANDVQRRFWAECPEAWGDD